MKRIVERGMELGFYQGVNFESQFCSDCDNHSNVTPNNINTCPVCGSHNVTTISRVCGYLGYSAVGGNTRFNDGKLAELNFLVPIGDYYQYCKLDF